MSNFRDIRDFIDQLEGAGDVKVLEGADWNEEIGLITEWQSALKDHPLLVFDAIKDYPRGFRVATNLYSTPRRTAIALDLPPELRGMALVRALKDGFQKRFQKLIPPEHTNDAPVKENVVVGNDVDLAKFPTPKWHRHDGGRYIGTANAVIMKDPDSGWVNLGTYRAQVHDGRTVTIWWVPGRDADLIARKWWAAGKPCPVAIAMGLEPVLWGTCTFDVPSGVSEYEYAGAYRGQPIEVTRGETVDLPIPARAEIVLEGEMVEGDTRMEGPFGEYSGYYATGVTPVPAMQVNAILHRNNPILHGAPPLLITSAWTLAHSYRRAANTWNELEKLIPGVVGVWLQDYGSYRPIVISLKQMWDGHARQVAMLALSIHASGFNNRFLIIVDDDIDPSDPQQVLWSLATRCNPDEQIDIIHGTRGSVIDPALHPEKKKKGEVALSTAIVLACKPYPWIKDFPRTIMSTPEQLAATREKWGGFFER